MIVVLDANVLYPPSLRDLLLTLAGFDAFDIRWSDQILDEVVRNVIEDHPDLDAARFVDHTIASMRRAFPDASVPAPAVVHLAGRWKNPKRSAQEIVGLLTVHPSLGAPMERLGPLLPE